MFNATGRFNALAKHTEKLEPYTRFLDARRWGETKNGNLPQGLKKEDISAYFSARDSVHETFSLLQMRTQSAGGFIASFLPWSKTYQVRKQFHKAAKALSVQHKKLSRYFLGTHHLVKKSTTTHDALARLHQGVGEPKRATQSRVSVSPTSKPNKKLKPVQSRSVLTGEATSVSNVETDYAFSLRR
jgi:hypothetical protein